MATKISKLARYGELRWPKLMIFRRELTPVVRVLVLKLIAKTGLNLYGADIRRKISISCMIHCNYVTSTKFQRHVHRARKIAKYSIPEQVIQNLLHRKHNRRF